MNWPRQVKPHRDKPEEPTRPFWLFRLSSRPGYILSLLLLYRKLESSFTRIEENEKRKLAELSISFSVTERKTCATKKNILLIQYFQFQSFECLSFLFNGSCLFRCVVFQLWYSKTFHVISFSFFFLAKTNRLLQALRISWKSLLDRGKQHFLKPPFWFGEEVIFSHSLNPTESTTM